jgi:FdhD protein
VVSQRRVAKHRVVAVHDGAARRETDELAGEEPLEVRVDGQSVAVTMRTPGDDFDLALGFVFTEGIVGADDVSAVRYCVSAPQEQQYNLVDVQRRVPGPLDDAVRRNAYVSSSCGVCGTASIDNIRRGAGEVVDDTCVGVALITSLPDRLRDAQRVFERTGGLHAAGLFDTAGDLLCLREDVGRHNAVDKVIGWAVRERRVPLSGCILVVSGRVAFEIVQKAVFAGIPIIAAISAPTSLAVTLAKEAGITLAGFVRGVDMNLYSHPHRIITS